MVPGHEGKTAVVAATEPRSFPGGQGCDGAEVSVVYPSSEICSGSHVDDVEVHVSMIRTALAPDLAGNLACGRYTRLAMCGRVDIHTPPAELARALEAQLAAGVDPQGQPSWNVGPTRAVPALVGQEDHSRALDFFRWGLVPHWAKNPKIGYKMINARAETASTSNAYKRALEHRRCLVVADGFYEWAVPDPSRPKQKVPFYFTRRDGTPITFAGLYETWWDKSRSSPTEPDPDSYLQTCVIMTTDAGPDLQGVHDRMPVIIEPADRDRWLDPDVQDPAAVSGLLKPSPSGTLVRHPVSTEVNSTRNDGPELIVPDPSVDSDLFLLEGEADGAEGKGAEEAAAAERSPRNRKR